MKDIIRKILTEDLNSMNINSVMEKPIEEWKNSLESQFKNEPVVLNQFVKAFYKILKIDEEENTIEYKLIFTDEEVEEGIKIQGSGFRGRAEDRLVWDYEDEKDFSFFGGGEGVFVNTDLMDDEWTLLPKKMEYTTMSKYQRKLSGMLSDIHNTQQTQNISWRDITSQLIGKLEESNNKVLELKKKYGETDTTEERKITKQISAIRNTLSRMFNEKPNS
jgi:hypothetical protein